MREIKFRGRHKIAGTWYCGFFYKQDNDYIITTDGYRRFVVEKDSISQFTGLFDKNGVAEVYEGDIIDTYGNIKGNIYEMDKRETDLVIQGFGTSSWEATNKEAMARGLKYSE